MLFAVTPDGAPLLTEDRKRRDHWLCQRLKDFTPEEIATLREAAPLLERLASRDGAPQPVARDVGWLLWLISALFVVYFAIDPIERLLGVK